MSLTWRNAIVIYQSQFCEAKHIEYDQVLFNKWTNETYSKSFIRINENQLNTE